MNKQTQPTFEDLERTSTTLSPDAWNKLNEILDNPPAPNENLKRLMAGEKLANSNKLE